MKIIVGLGNPGKKYDGTRHNAGFMLIDALSVCQEISPAGERPVFGIDSKFDAEVATFNYNGEKIVLVKPLTYMNLSGTAVAKILNFYKADISDLIVVLDDMDLTVGQARIRLEGSSAGQKGLQNIIDVLKTDQFARIRLGISRSSENKDEVAREIKTIDFVLSKFSAKEQKLLKTAVSETINYILPHLAQNNPLSACTINVAIDSL